MTNKAGEQPTITQSPVGVEKPYAYCCNGNPDACDCVRPDHGTAFYQAVCTIPNCRNRAPADEAFCSKHRTTSLAAQDGLVDALEIMRHAIATGDTDWAVELINKTLSAMKGGKS